MIGTLDHTMSTLLGKIKECWKLNRDKSLGWMLKEISVLSDNPFTDPDLQTDTELEKGADRYLTQERRDHPERFVQADAESKAELEEERAQTNKPKEKAFKDMTLEEKKAWRIENLRKAREAKKQKELAGH